MRGKLNRTVLLDLVSDDVDDRNCFHAVFRCLRRCDWCTACWVVVRDLCDCGDPGGWGDRGESGGGDCVMVTDNGDGDVGGVW